MAQVRIYNQEQNRFFNINFDLRQNIVSDGSDVEVDYFLVVSTNIPRPDGSRFPTYTVKDLSDIPEDVEMSSEEIENFTDLCRAYVSYFTVYGQQVESSSSEVESSSEESSSSEVI